jgi:hypothetical protein
MTDGWSETVLPSISGSEHAQARIAFHIGAKYVLQIVEQVVAHGSAEAAALALSTLGAELNEFMKTSAIRISIGVRWGALAERIPPP